MKKLFYLLETSDPSTTLPIITTLISISLVTITFFVLYQQLPPKLPLFYSLPWGQLQLVAKQQFLLLPSVLFLMGIVNTALAFQLPNSQVVLKKILLLSLFVMDLIVLIATIKILSIFT